MSRAICYDPTRCGRAFLQSGSIAKDVNVIGALAMLSADGNG
jgi:hypothetical protein